MAEGFAYDGLWFLPSNPKKKLNGELRYTGEGHAILKVYGRFDYDKPSMGMPPIGSEDIILGITTDGQLVTLHMCTGHKTGNLTYIVNQEVSIPVNFYKVTFVFNGVHIDDAEEIRFQKISGEINYLGEWLDITGFSDNCFEGSSVNEVRLSYDRPSEISFEINDHLSGLISFQIESLPTARYCDSITLKQSIFLTLISSKEVAYQELLDYLKQFRDFLALAFYEETHISSAKFYSNKWLNRNSKPVGVQLHNSWIIKQKEVPKSEYSKCDMLFCYSDIQEEFPTIIRNWYNHYEIAKPALILLTDQFFKGNHFDENIFLNLAQATETFHAHTNENHTIWPKAEFKNIMETILSHCPTDYYKRIRDKIIFANSFTLHERLNDLIEKSSTEFLNAIIKDKESFIKDVKRSRNYYTHYASDPKALKGWDLFYLSEKLKVLLVCSILVTIGFDKSRLNELLDSCKHSLFAHLLK